MNWQEFIFNVASTSLDIYSLRIVSRCRKSRCANRDSTHGTRNRIKMKGYRDDVLLPRREGQASREGCRRNIVPSWKERWSIRRFIVTSSANPWRKGENKKRVNCPRDERTVFGRVAGARRRARRGEQKGRISSSRRRALFTLGEGLEQARQLSTTRPFALHPRHMA